MDNEASSAVMDWLQRMKQVDAQKVSPHNHRANVAEIMIETGKHHLISGIAGTDENFPITQWDRLIPQTQRTLNMVRLCRINPKLSADAFLEGQHDYNAVPFSPLGWRMLIFEGPDQQSSWGFHAVEGYSIGPAEENYRSYSGLVTLTGAVRISDTVMFFFLQRYTYDLPAPPTPEEVVQESARALGESLKQLATNNLVYTHLTNFLDLQQISDMVNSATKKAADAKSRGKKRVTSPDLPVRQRVGPHIIEDDTPELTDHVEDMIQNKGRKDART